MHCRMREEGVGEVEPDQYLKEQQLDLKSLDLIVLLEGLPVG